MIELIISSAVVLAGAVLLVMAVRRFKPLERQFIFVSYLAHVIAGVAQVIIAENVYQGGDNIAYMNEGSLLARAIEIHPERFGRLWLNVLLHQESEEVFPILGAGSSTGTMVAVAAALALVFRYSLYAACLAATVAAFMGKLALYRVFRELLPESTCVRSLIGVFAMPSAVFWASGLQKEALVLAGIGPLWLGVHRILRGHYVRGALIAAVGVMPIALLKPYTFFPLTVAAGAWIGVDRLRLRQGGSGPVRLRPIYLVLAAVLIYGGVVALGQIYPAYSVDNIGEDLAKHQGLGVMTTKMMTSQGGGASFYAMGDQTAMSLQKQIAFAPLAMATALFRPFPFEANNGLAFAASLEVFVLTVLIIHLFISAGPRAAFVKIMSTPVLFASLLFALIFGMAVGLATTNFGSLSRYRMPLIPFYATVVLVLGARPLASRLRKPIPDDRSRRRTLEPRLQSRR